jgi:hypothetical protein
VLQGQKMTPKPRQTRRPIQGTTNLRSTQTLLLLQRVRMRGQQAEQQQLAVLLRAPQD